MIRSVETLTSYRHKTARLLRFAGVDALDEVTQAHVDAFRRDGPSLGLAPVTINTAVETVQIVTGRKFHGRPLTVPDKCPDLVPLDDLGAVYQVAKDRGNGLIARFLKWAYCTGLRLSDLLSLTRQQMMPDDRVLTIGAAKSKKLHLIPLHPILCCRLPATEFPLRKSPSRLRDKIKYYCDAAGVPHFGPQMIRATAATQYELARPGAGAIIQGSGIKMRERVTWKHYINQVPILRQAHERLAIPQQTLPANLRDKHRRQRRELLTYFDRLNESDRAIALRVISGFDAV